MVDRSQSSPSAWASNRPPCESCGRPTYYFPGSGRECEGRVRYSEGRKLKPLCKTGPNPVPEARGYTLSASGGVVTIELHAAERNTAGSVPVAVLVLDKDRAKAFRDGAGFVAHVANGGSCGCGPEEAAPDG